MFGFFNSVGENAAIQNKNTDNTEHDPCFGGVSSRLRYEECRQPRRARPATILLVIFSCTFLGIIGVAAGLLVYDFVQSNRSLYYPCDHSTPSDTPSVGELSSGENGAYEINGISFEAVTEEQSTRYRIPRGVMVRSSDESDDFLAPGDIIVALNGEEVTEIAHIESFSAASPYSVRIFRDNKYIDIAVSPSEAE